MEEFGAEAVADIHHGSRHDSGFGKFLYDISTGFRFQLSLHEIFLPFKPWDKLGQSIPVTFFTGFVHLLIVYGLFAFKQLQSHVCSPEVA